MVTVARSAPGCICGLERIGSRRPELRVYQEVRWEARLWTHLCQVIAGLRSRASAVWRPKAGITWVGQRRNGTESFAETTSAEHRLRSTRSGDNARGGAGKTLVREKPRPSISSTPMSRTSSSPTT